MVARTGCNGWLTIRTNGVQFQPDPATFGRIEVFAELQELFKIHLFKRTVIVFFHVGGKDWDLEFEGHFDDFPNKLNSYL